MRFAFLAASAAACALSVPAGAAVVISLHADATGTTSTRVMCPGGGFNCQIVTPVSQSFDAAFAIPDFVNGQSTFGFGPYNGTVLDLGNGQLTGIDFVYWQNFQNTETRLAAATFQVTQISPVPLPEPSTWAMTLVGFGFAGYAMRRRQVQWMVNSKSEVA